MFRLNKYFQKNNTLFIAEFANAFEGKKDLALKMIDKAIEADVDALKFQIFFTNELLVPEHPKYNIFKKLETKVDDWYSIIDYAAHTNKLIFADVYGEQSFQFSKNFKIDAYKIASSEITNFNLIKSVSSLGISMMLSTGSVTFKEIGNAINICKKNKVNDLVLLHGFQSYPTKLEDVNLNLIKTLKSTFHCPVGYADHVDGSSEMAVIVPLLAIAKGARLIEKHFTLNRSLKGIDYESSVNPDVLKKVVQFVKDTNIAFGKSSKKLSKDELVYKNDIRKRIVTRKKLKIGEKIDEEDMVLKRAHKGIFAEELKRIIGKKVARKLEKNQVVEWKDIK